MAVVVGIDEATPARQKTTSDDLHVVISAYDAGGQPAGSVTTHVKVGMPAGDENVRYEVLASLALKPGRYELRVTAASMAAKESGGLISSVDVPDFARARLSLSGLVLATTPAAMATPRDALRSFLSVTPSSRRVFAPDENVMALVRAYPSAGGRSPVPALVVQVIDVNGTIVFRADVPPSGDAPARTAGTEYRLALPLRCLGPGSYLLKAVANRGNDTAERNLRFEVR